MSKPEFPDYIRRPKINPASGLALAIRLLQSAPKQELPEQVVAALLDMRGAAEGLQYALQHQHTLDSSSLRPYDRRFDGSWGGLYPGVARGQAARAA